LHFSPDPLAVFDREDLFMTLRWSLPFVVAAVLSTSSPSALAQANCGGISPTSNTTLTSVLVADGFVNKPIFATSPPGDRNRLFVVEQDGYIRIHQRGDDPASWTTFLNIDAKVFTSSFSNELGLLGMAFDPNYATNGFFYVYYSEGSGLFGPWFNVLARYSVSAGDPNLADPNSEVRLLRYQKPTGESNHNGGWLAFGPDGYLYLSIGDGGGGNDNHGTCGNGQSTTNILGKLLRIDPAQSPANRPPDCSGLPGTPPYRIPADNPLVGGSATNCEEIYATGLRNPWRPSFDRVTGDLYIADVGQNCWEEVNFSAVGTARGRNFGWREMEGTHCFNIATASNCNSSPSSGCPRTCNDPAFTWPVLDYSHSDGCSVTGGYSYRGCRMPNFQGTYFYSDYCTGFIRSFQVVGGVATNPQSWGTQLFPSGVPTNSWVSYAEDQEGEVYLIDNGGQLFLIAPPFSSLEVAGKGVSNADQFWVRKTSDWTWENLEVSSQQPVANYRVFRSTSATGTFSCVHQTSNTSWAGDPANPAAASAFFYLVTAVTSTGLQTSPGAGRALSPAACP
jgi:glucose/arabinose dehydrogenase